VGIVTTIEPAVRDETPDVATLSTQPTPPDRDGRRYVGVLGRARRGWRRLTSMRTALMLLFLLALAAVPGSLLPQRPLNPVKVDRYLAEHGALGRLLDRLGGFDVFGTPWFAAIYLLLFVSLVGCLLPRLRGHLVALVRVPPDAPRRLDRLAIHADGLEVAGDRAEVAERLKAALRRRRFRTVVRPQDGGGFTISAEKGYVKETGNLLFHFALLALLLGVAFGSWYGYHANRLVVQGTDQSFCNTLQQYDDYGLGSRVSPRDLEPFCLTLNDFQATYTDAGEPIDFRAAVSYTVGDGPVTSTVIKVNDPLRLARARLYLLGHGYAPVLRYTDRYGHTQTQLAPFPDADATLTSSGVIEFPDANIDPAKGPDPTNKQQVAFSGVYVPTSDGTSAFSTFPAERNPVLVVTPYRGDLGLDAGIPGSVYALDQHQIDTGRLKAVSAAPIRLGPGQTATLDDGTKVEFLGTRPWITMAVRYDPGETVVLVGAVCLLVGLLISLTGRRRRIWFRVPPDGPISAGALSRSESTGLRTEFDTLMKEVE
jgi:cytochrome c biogenesis protein